jgi:hypothetical protein
MSWKCATGSIKNEGPSRRAPLCQSVIAQKRGPVECPLPFRCFRIADEVFLEIMPVVTSPSATNCMLRKWL